MKTVRKHDKKPADQDDIKRGEVMTSWEETQRPAPTAAIREFLRNSISLSDVLEQLWRGRLVLVAALLLGIFYGLYIAHRAGPLFSAAMAVMPAETDNDSGGGGGSGAIGMLANLTGGDSSDAGQVPKFTQFMDSIGSVAVAQILDRKYDMVCTIYRGLCDPKTHVWKHRTGLNAAFDAFLARVAGLPDPNGALTVIDLAGMNNAAISVTKDKITGLVTLRYFNRDPKFAADYLSKVVSVTNDFVRDQDRGTQRTYVDYLTHRIATNTNVEQRTALDSLLLSEERRLMMTEVNVPYAATILDGPTVTPVNTVLRTSLLNALFFLLGGVFIVLCRNLVPARFRFWSGIWQRF